MSYFPFSGRNTDPNKSRFLSSPFLHCVFAGCRATPPWWGDGSSKMRKQNLYGCCFLFAQDRYRRLHIINFVHETFCFLRRCCLVNWMLEIFFLWPSHNCWGNILSDPGAIALPRALWFMHKILGSKEQNQSILHTIACGCLMWM